MSERIDTRDLVAERDGLRADLEESGPEAGEMALSAQGCEVALSEIAEIDELESAIGDEFEHGVLLIPETDFEDYAQELAEEIGDIPTEYRWPTSCIDWERAARDLAMDYTLITFRDVDYLVRLG